MVKTNEEILKELVEAMDVFGKKYERIKLFQPFYDRMMFKDVPNLHDSINNSSKQFLRRNFIEDWDKIISENRAKILDFIDFVKNEDNDEDI